MKNVFEKFRVDQSQKEFMADTSRENVQQVRLLGYVVLWGAVAFFALAFIWAKYAILDEVTTGEGKVIPSRKIQVIQNLEGGIINMIFVKEGTIVEKDQVLMQIDQTRFAATVKEQNVKAIALHIKVLRLKAEVEEKPFIVPVSLRKKDPDQVKQAGRLYQSNMETLRRLKRSYQLANKELALTRPLVEKGAASPVEVLRLERTVNELQSEVTKFKAKIIEQLNGVEAEYEAMTESAVTERDRLARTTVRSPVKGIVKQLKINTLGGVVQPGDDLLEIVPLEDTLLIEARIRPSDIGFIHPDQKAMVKISAYDFSIYGGLEGKIEQISADTIQNEKGDSYYEIRVRTDKNFLGTNEVPLYIIPGMHATVDILTGQKSVLDYLLKPILKTKQNALRER